MALNAVAKVQALRKTDEGFFYMRSVRHICGQEGGNPLPSTIDHTLDNT